MAASTKLLRWLGSPVGLSCWLLLALAILTVTTSGVSLLVNSVIIGLIWALVAAGLTLVFGIMNVPNFAQGALFMVGTLAAYLLYSRLNVPSMTGIARTLAPLAIVIVSAAITAIVGMIVERVFLYALRRRSGPDWVTNTFVMTVALGLLLVNLHQVLFGANSKGIVGYFPDSGPLILGETVIAADRVFAAAISITALALLGLLLTQTRIGREMRAVSQDETGARFIGISVEKIHCITFALSAALAGLAGATMLFLFPSSPHVGDGPLYLAWTVVILGGLGIGGTVVAGIAIALINNNTSFLLGTTWTSVAPFALMVVLLLIRPTGLFGRATKGVWER